MTNPKSSLRWKGVYKTKHPSAYLDGSCAGNSALLLAVGEKKVKPFLRVSRDLRVGMSVS